MEEADFEIGELYLFHRTKAGCPSEESLWGVFDRIEAGHIRLESSSSDLRGFRLWHRLPADYRYARRASRAELRDYAFNLACSPCFMAEQETPPVAAQP